MTDNIIQIYNW